MIVDGQGHVVWFHQLQLPEVAGNLRIQHYAGKPVLTWWQGPVTVAAFGLGEGVIADTSLPHARTRARRQRLPDGPPRARAHAGGRRAVHDLLAGAGAPARHAGRHALPALDAIVQQVDVAHRARRLGVARARPRPAARSPTPRRPTARPTTSSTSTRSRRSPGGRVLLSARDTSALYLVDRPTGHVLWTLGGKASDFRLARGARFWFQHDAAHAAGRPDQPLRRRGRARRRRRRPPAGCPRARPAPPPSRRVVRSYRRAADTSAQSEGSVQTRPGGDVFVGFGSTPFFSEFTTRRAAALRRPAARTATAATASCASPGARRRRTRPAVAVQRVDRARPRRGLRELERRDDGPALAGAGRPRRRSPAPLAAGARHGFETRLDVATTATRFAVRALGARGRRLATSAPVAAP